MTRFCECCGSSNYYCKGLCKRCYNRQLRTGSLELVVSGSIWERLWRQVEPSNGGCWIWTGAVDGNGYGTMWWKGKQRAVHRVTWVEIAGNHLIDGLVLDHVCQVRQCVNPSHLEQVTQSLNVLRGQRYGDRCKNGHQYDGTYQRKNRRYPYRTCSQCTGQRGK